MLSRGKGVKGKGNRGSNSATLRSRRFAAVAYRRNATKSVGLAPLGQLRYLTLAPSKVEGLARRRFKYNIGLF